MYVKYLKIRFKELISIKLIDADVAVFVISSHFFFANMPEKSQPDVGLLPPPPFLQGEGEGFIRESGWSWVLIIRPRAHTPRR